MTDLPCFSRSLNEADGKSIISWASHGANSGEGGIYGSIYGSYLGINKAKVPFYMKWSFCLEYLLEDAIGVSLFKTYLDTEKCSHLLEFWFACQGFRMKVDPFDHKKIKTLIKAIYKTYIKPENQVFPCKNIVIKSDTIKRISEKIKTKSDINQTIFNEAQTEVEDFLRNSAYPNFLRSEFYLDYLEKCKVSSLMDTQKVNPVESKEYRKIKQYKIIEENMKISRYIEKELSCFQDENVYQNIQENSKNPEETRAICEGVNNPNNDISTAIMSEFPVNPYAITCYAPTTSKLHENFPKKNDKPKSKKMCDRRKTCHESVENTKLSRAISFRHSHPQNRTSDKKDFNNEGISKSAGPLTSTASARVPYPNMKKIENTFSRENNEKIQTLQDESSKTDSNNKKVENLAETNPDLFFELVSKKIYEQKDNFAAIRKAARSLIERNRQDKQNENTSIVKMDNEKQWSEEKKSVPLLQTSWADRLLKEAQSESENPQEAQSILEDHCSRIWARTSDGTPNNPNFSTEMSIYNEKVSSSDYVDTASEIIISQLLESVKIHQGESRSKQFSSNRQIQTASKRDGKFDLEDNNKITRKRFDTSLVTESLKQTSTCAMGIQSISTRHNNKKKVFDNFSHESDCRQNRLHDGSQENSSSTTESTSSSSKSGHLVVGYYLGDDPVPYRSQWPHSTLSLAQFKQLIPKKGKFRYFFKKASDEFDTGGVVQQEISDEETILPLWEGKIIAKVERVD